MTVVPAATVILPLYNCGPDLEMCFSRLDSLEGGGYEIIIVDDGSTDETPTRSAAYAANRSNTHFYRMDTNLGVAAARNFALTKASGEYIWFVDWDDRWEESILERMLVRARALDADVVVCRAIRELSSGEMGESLDGLSVECTFDGPTAFEMVLRGELRGYLWSKLLRRRILPADMFPPMRSQSDFCGLVPVLAAAERIVTVSDTLYYHVTREGSITNTRDPRLENFTICRDLVHRVAVDDMNLSTASPWLLHYDYRFWHLALANTALRLSTRASAIAVVTQVARDMRLAQIAKLVFVSPSTSARSLAVKLSGPRYGFVYDTFVGARARLRKRTILS